MRVVVAGASGFVGRRLCPALQDAGHDVVAMTRHPERYDGAGTAVRADVQDVDSLLVALEGADAAYYLVHSLDSPDFIRKDAEAAEAFATAAGSAGSGGSSTWAVSATTPTTSRRTCAAGARWSASSPAAASRSPCCAPASSSGTAASPGR
jgi:uncharacterized protein YbjT (DUF2867 family)